MHICFIVEGYPTSKDPFMPFIKNTVAEMAKQGIKCSVIAPQSITRALSHKVPLRPQHWIDRIDNNEAQVEVYQPMYLTLSGKAGKVNRELFLRRRNQHTIKFGLGILMLCMHISGIWV